MKKAILAVALTLATGLASAAEFGVQGIRDYGSNPDRNGFGVTLGQKFGKVGATAGYERFTQNSNDLNRYTLVGSYDVVKIGTATVAAKAGVAYQDAQTTPNNWAGVAGVGVSVPLNKTVALTADYRYLNSFSNKVNAGAFDGNSLSAGIKVSF